MKNLAKLQDKKYITKQGWSSLAFSLLIGLITLLFFLKRCESKPVIFTDLKSELKAQDSFRTIIKYKDSVRVKELVKWRNMTRINDSFPCYSEIKTIIAEADTIIKIDSVEIGNLKTLVSLDSVIQVKLFDRIVSDSVTICKLNRKVKRNRVIAKLAFLAGLGSGSYLGFKLH